MVGRFTALVLLLSVAAPASSIAAPGDPGAGSPPGGVYELPFEKGRTDAAPRGQSGGGGDLSGSGEGGSFAQGGEDGAPEGGSLYRSENNFGSSGQVPGRDENGTSEVADPDAALGLQAVDPAVDAGDPSEWRTYAFLAVLVLGGIGIGIAARHWLRG